MTARILFSCLAIALAAGAAQPPTYGTLPLSFAENLGQAPQEARFVAQGPGYRVLLSSNTAEINAIRMTLFGAAPSPRIEGAQPLWPVHYLIGRDPSRWRTNVQTYGRVLYHSVYPGIDLVYYGNERQLEYDFTVAPGADPRTIRLEIEGSKNLSVGGNGDLVLGPLHLRKPLAYQTIDGARREVACAYQLRGRRVVFRTGSYDRTRPLVIDPVFVYSTYLGGSGSIDGARTIAVDRQGNAYVAGQTNSADFPVTPGAFQPHVAVGPCGADSPYACPDIFIAKLNPAGAALVYATYLGGTYTDGPIRIAVDQQGSVVILLSTVSYDFPVVNPLFQNPIQPDAPLRYFLAKLSPDGSRLLYSTPLPDGYSGVTDLAVDSDGSVWLTGVANANLPVVKPLQQYVPPASIYRSTDRGATWQPLGAVPSQLPDIVAFAVDPKSPLNLYAVTYDWARYSITGSQSLFQRSADGGRTWTTSATALPGASPYAGYPAALAIDPVTPSTIYLGTRAGVFKSADRGDTWVQAGQAMAVMSIAIDPRNPSALYVATLAGPVYKSKDSGASWTATSVSAAVVAIDPRTTATVYAAGGNTIYKSTDAGATWTPSNYGITSNAVIRALAIDPVSPYILYAAGTGRPNLVHKSTDGGATWQPMVGGLLLGEVTGLVLNPLAPSELFTTAWDGISVSTDGAATWAPVVRQMPYQSPTLAIDPSSGALFAPLPGTRSYAAALAFVAKIDAAGSALLFSTPLGGSFYDSGWAIAVDRAGRVYVGGSTYSPDFPLMNPLQPRKVRYSAGFLAVLAGDGSAMLSSTYLDYPAWALVVDAANRAHVIAGAALSSLDPLAPAWVYSIPWSSIGSTFTVDRAGNAYVWGSCYIAPNYWLSFPWRITKLDPAGRTVFSSCFGGGSNDGVVALTTDDSGGLYLAGVTSSPDFPTLNAFQPVLNGPLDAFITKIDTNAQAPTPVLRSVVGAASYRPEAVAPGSLVALFGADLASDVAAPGRIPLPNTLVGARVSFNGFPAPLLYVSPDQINAQVPFEVTPGNVTVSVARWDQSASLTVAVAPAGPGIFTRNAQGTGPAAILHAGDLSPVNDASPAHAGEALAIYCTGLGIMDPPVATGNAPPAPPPNTVFQPQVRIAGRSAEVTYSGAAPQFVGLYQVNIVAPADTPAGLQSLVLTINGVDSNTVQVAVR
jgi:uncharacterized protein (TIGR03437 family)